MISDNRTLTRSRALVIVLVAVIVLITTFSLARVFDRNGNSAAEADASDTCRALIANFADYPLVYAGDEFEGLPLTTCMRRWAAGTTYGTPPTDQVIFIYGTCQPDLSDTEPSCNPPLQIHVYPSCMPLPDVPTPSDQIRRGVATVFQNRGSSVFADAISYHVKISAWSGDRAADHAVVLRAFDALRGANPPAAALTPSSSLTALGDTPAPHGQTCAPPPAGA